MRIAPVFELIKTLTPGEVKMLRKRSESPTAAYIGLLDIILRAEKNSDVVFKAAFEKQLPGTDYIETKSYLYRYILRHLTGQEPQPNAFAQINYNFVTAEMLLLRGLAAEAITVFKQANQQAQKEGFFQLCVVAIRRIKNIKLKTARTKKDYEAIRLLHKQEAEAVQNDRDVSESMMLYTNLLELIEQYGGPVNEKILKRFEKIVTHPLIVNRAAIQSPQARLIVFDLITNYYRLTNQGALFKREYQLELARYTPALLKDPYYAYRNIFMLHNFTCDGNSSAADTKKYLGLLKKAPAPDKRTAAYKQLFMLHARLSTPTKDDAKLIKLANDVKAQLREPWLAEKAKERMNLLSHILQVLTAKNKYDIAEEFLQPALNDKLFEENLPAEFTGLRLFYLLVLFEQKRFSEMEPVIRATKYALKTKGLENEVSNQLLTFFSALMRHAPAARQRAILGQIRKLLATIPYFRYQQLGVTSFLESAWFKAKID